MAYLIFDGTAAEAIAFYGKQSSGMLARNYFWLDL
jgi:uncharacterized glyoxalase superfamily protein PhnB